MLGDYVHFLEKTMDVSALKRKVNADNISNINTPGFKATNVEFDYLFDQKMSVEPKVSRDKHIEIDMPNKDGVQLTKNTTTKERYDGNNVDLNKEMVEMIKNNYQFGIAVQSINKEFSLNKTAIGRN